MKHHAGFALRHYTITFGAGPHERARFASGVRLAESALPSPARTAARPGIGLLIEHQGNGADYVVLGWWDRENELPLRVFRREESGWRPATGSESVCVWDLAVLSTERDVYVRTMLAPSGPDPLAWAAAVSAEVGV